MNPTLDQVLVAALILGALGFFLTRFLRKRSAGKACGGDCCGTTKSNPTLHK